MAEPDSHYLTKAEIASWAPDRPTPGNYSAPLRHRLEQAGQWTENQIAGRHWAIACVSLEITQRCNLDCTLCYLSDHSEAVKDVPLAEIYRRIDMIYRHYGPNTDIQVSGGDPTLRKRHELVAIVARIAKMDMRPSLFTNGIKATRDLLRELADNGLVDVAFHVDLTQQRKGYTTERDLNALRLDYIERARGLGLSVFFNTTVFKGNFTEIPEITRFFRHHADVVRLASFQLQAETGRGVLRGRAALITQESVAAQISAGAGVALNFDVPRVGHPSCNSYAICLEANADLYDLCDDPGFAQSIVDSMVGSPIDRKSKSQVVATFLRAILRDRSLWLPTLRFVARKAWQMKASLLASRARVNKLSFFIHNFQDAERLQHDRCEACVFMVATSQGPLSMCVYNAKRDIDILKPLTIHGDDGRHHEWDPVTGVMTDLQLPTGAAPSTPALPLKRLKGRARQLALARANLVVRI
ncbi:MAG: radical SAM protein [Alphaproteobacteria bacterium]